MVRSVYRTVLIVLGFIFMGIGTVGIFVPLLPTTVFLLLAAACFIRSSDRLYNWLMNHRVFGSYIKNFREHRAMSRQTKITVLTLLWGTLIVSSMIHFNRWWLVLLLMTVGVGVTIYLSRLKTLPARENQAE